MNKLFLSVAFFTATFFSQAQIVSTGNGEIKIFGTSPATDVEATSKKLTGAMNVAERKFAFKIDMLTMDFPNDEMENHFNEKYMQTDVKENRYGQFKGKINDNIDLTKNGTYKVSCSGEFTCHNVPITKNLIVNITVKDGKVSADCEFYVNLKEHKIEVPTLVFAKIGENIKVNVKCDMLEKKN